MSSRAKPKGLYRVIFDAERLSAGFRLRLSKCPSGNNLVLGPSAALWLSQPTGAVVQALWLTVRHVGGVANKQRADNVP